jgi:ATP-dependent DNA helicase RecQ
MPGTLAQPETLPSLLHSVFGHREFRPHQQLVCEAAAAGRDVLLVMPTGAGKSLCYQLPALARRSLGEASTALVISPLIALMDDQAGKLTALGLKVARIHSGLSREDARQACRDYLAGELDFLFIAPERMRVPGFPQMLAKRKPTLIAIDEAHCISAWGHDFRPDYRTLGQHLPALRPAPIIALTATATPTVQRDIARQLDLREPATFITGFRRSNLAVEVVELSKPQRPEFALKLLKQPGARPAIVYAQSRKDAEEFATKLNQHFPTAAYHAGLGPQVREKVQRDFLSGKLEVIVATVAFGMGVDKADVRTVVHVALPGSVESYYQEIGRAGRDGLPSRTVLLHGFADRRLQEFLLEKNYPPITDLERVARILPAEFTLIDVLHNALVKQKVAIDRETLERTIEKLLVAGIVTMDINGEVRRADEPSTNPGAPHLDSEMWDSTTAPTWQSAYTSQIAVRRAQIDRMIAFAESTTCRMAALVQHFGDTTDRAPTCGLCDICDPASAGSSNAAHQPTTQERAWLREILSALAGRSTSTGKLFTDLHLMKDRGDFDTLLDALARAGLITLTNDTFRSPDGRDVTYKKAGITHDGRLSGDQRTDDATLDTVWIRGSLSAEPTGKKRSVKKPGAPSSKASTSRVGSHDVGTINPTAERLFEQLRAWRTEQARPTKTPAFMILSDAVLRAIATRSPQNLTALNAIPGMGPTKVDKYGAELIALCRGGEATQKPGAPGLVSDTRVHTPDTDAQPPTPTPTLSSRSEAARFAAGVERPAARTTAQTHAIPPTKRPGTPEPPPTLTESQLALEDRLKLWRRDEAKAAGLPSFFILSDTVLRNIVLAAPTTLDGLRDVRGLAADKLDRFGQPVIDLCRP